MLFWMENMSDQKNEEKMIISISYKDFQTE